MMSDIIGYEVEVSRIKLRMRINPNPNPKRTAANFNFHFQKKLLVDDFQFDHIIEERDFPKQVCTASKHNPLPFCSTRTTIASALSKITDLDPEFRPIITRHVIAFARRCRHRNPSFSIDVDIKKVTGSFFVTGESERVWEDFEYGHWNMTSRGGWMVDDDDVSFDVVKYLDNMTSFVRVPCEGCGDLKAVSYDSDEVCRIGTCAICLVDFDPDEEPMMSVLKMPCGHVFHHECIVSWIRSNSACVTPTCPLCRSTMHFLKVGDT